LTHWGLSSGLPVYKMAQECIDTTHRFAASTKPNAGPQEGPQEYAANHHQLDESTLEHSNNITAIGTHRAFRPQGRRLAFSTGFML